MLCQKKTHRSVIYRLNEHVAGLKVAGTDIGEVAKGNISITPLTLAFTDEYMLQKMSRGSGHNTIKGLTP